MKHPLAVAVTLLLAVASCSAPVAPPPAIVLRAATASLPVDFSYVGSTRELSDGRVLIADEHENRVFVADSALSGVTEIGRHGDGPGEFRAISLLWATGGDSTLLPERDLPRAAVLVGSQPSGTIPRQDPRIGSFLTASEYGIDNSGAVAGAAFPAKIGGQLATDSLLLLRISPTGHVDTVARTRDSQDGSESAGGAAPADGKKHYMVMGGFQDFATMFADGWIAIARVNPYRVDWCAPIRACVAGPVLAKSIPMNDREKHAYLAMTAKTSGWPPTSDLEETVGWPTTLPPFTYPSSQYTARVLTALPSGNVLVERLPSADFPLRRYDMVARTGKLVGQFSVQLNERIVGSGAHALYLARTDSNGVQRIERRPWP